MKVTPTIAAELVDRHMDGASCVQLAREYGLHHSTVRRYLIKAGVFIRTPWSRALIDLRGCIFGRLTVKHRAGRDRHGRVLWLAVCECGVELVALGESLRAGRLVSCSCWRREVLTRTARAKRKHGMSHTPTYRSWWAMTRRCMNHAHPAYLRYGGAGIGYCAAWGTFAGFLKDMGLRPSGKTLDRVDVAGNYELSNCRWATWSEQRLNQRRMAA